jgi:two-component system CheB/CheR fusion protein
MNFSLKGKLLTGYSVTAFLLLFVAVICLVTFQNFVKSQELLNHTNEVINTLERAASVIKDAETGQRGYLLTRDKRFLEPYTGSREKAEQLIRHAQLLTADNPLQQRNMGLIATVLSRRLNLLETLLKKSQDEAVTINDLKEGKLAMDSFRKAIIQAEHTEKQLLKERLETHKKNVRYARFFVFAAAILSILTAIVSYLNIAKTIVDRAKMLENLEKKEKETAELNEELAAANEEMSAINEELLTGNEELMHTRESLARMNLELEQKVLDRTTALTLSQAKAYHILESIPQIAWTNTLSGEVDFFNRRWFEYTGLNFDQTKSWGWKAVIHLEDVDNNVRRYQEILSSGQAGEFEVREKRSDGQYRYHLVRMAPLVDVDGKPQSWVGTATDIQELREIQQQKDDFLNMASHELKTPLTSLKSSLQLLDAMYSGPGPDKLHELISRSNKSVNRIVSLVEGLLRLGRLSQGRLNLNISLVNLSQLIEQCVIQLDFFNKFSVVVSGEENIYAEADEEQLVQVINNFLTNILKYAPMSKVVRIDIRSMDGKTVRVTVTDQGPGIPAQMLPFLFDRYSRAHQDGAQSSGLGIGLYIGAEIIKKHAGEIGVDSEVDQGSSFWFSLPLRRTNERVGDAEN